MSTERDTTTRIVRSWLEAGSTAIPDRVVDAVLAELPSRPQRRPRWSLWRFPIMKPIIPVAVGAAAIVLAVVIGSQFLPSSSGVGGPTGSPAASAEPSTDAAEVAGQFTFLPNGEETVVVVDASASGSTLTGTADVEYVGGGFTIGFQCLRQFDDQTWILAGSITEGEPADMWMAIVVRDGSPQQVGFLNAEESVHDDCQEFVGDIPDSDVEGQDMIAPMADGGITLPPARAAE